MLLVSIEPAFSRGFLIGIKVTGALRCESERVKAVSETILPERNDDRKDPVKRPPTGSAIASQRLAREWRTLAGMVHCYCRAQHRTAVRLCPECQGLLDYAAVRLERCRFGVGKPTCVNCPVHCYQRDRREQVRQVMRYAGPRLVWRHPILSLRHWLDGFSRGTGS